MKCVNCGGTEFFETKILNDQVLKTEGYVEQTVQAFACLKCGRVQLYVPQKTIDEYLTREQEKKAKEIEMHELEQAITAAVERIRALEAVIEDEEQTVKTVNEAKAELQSEKVRLKELQKRRAGKQGWIKW